MDVNVGAPLAAPFPWGRASAARTTNVSVSAFLEVNMCLAVPMELTEITMDGVGKVNAGGVGTAVNIMMVPHAKIGDFLIIHAGFAIEVLNDDEARIRLDLFRELAEATANLEEY
jgi:hydrogenase expression/formation protein HypC